MVHKLLSVLIAFALMLSAVGLIAQESAVKGNIAGSVQDSTGAVVSGAKVTITGAMGSKSATTGADGRFAFPLLTLGSYSLRVEKSGFRAAQYTAITVETGKTATLTAILEPGLVTETVEVSGTAVTIDTTSSSVGANLSDQFYNSVPVPRNVAGLFYTAPGVADGGQTGTANPSIGGASGLENLYVADGVNITDAAFGGLGVFTRSHGASVSSGINLAFIKEVNVKTAGFEPQYGQADGGVVQIVTKSGGNAYHGAIAGYFAPQSLSATPLQSDNVRQFKSGYFYMPSNYDVSGEFGGYVPKLKNHLFFFGAVDPTWRTDFVQAANTTPLYDNGVYKRNFDTFNYSAKLTYRINDKHQVESSVFGDPSSRNTTINNLVAINNTGFSKWEYGTRNWVARYNGTLSSTWLVNGSFAWNHSTFTETPLQNSYAVSTNIAGVSTTRLQGFGFLENHETNNKSLNFDTSKVVHSAIGEHTFSVGYHYERPDYDNIRYYSSPENTGGTGSNFGFVVPDTNMAGQTLGSMYKNFNCDPSDPTCPIGKTSNAYYYLQTSASCDKCPLMNINGQVMPVYLSQYRGIFSSDVAPTSGRYHAAYINDSWAITNRINVSMGLRWEQWRMTGNSGSTYAMTDNWAPRFGLTVDPWGDRKTKFYANYGRYNYQTPLDAAIRNLSAESDLQKLYFAPDYDPATNMVKINSDGSLNVIPDSAHLLNGTAPGLINASPVVSISSPSGYVFAPGTKMQYEDEWVVGAEHEFKGGYVLSARFMYRNVGRTLEDVAGLSPEAYNFGLSQNYLIANPSRTLDLFPNEHSVLFPSGSAPAGCVIGDNATNTITDVNENVWLPGQGICFKPDANGYMGGELGPGNSPLPDGIADGYPNVVRHYKAVEIEFNKSFSQNWLMRANYRIASLVGNWEGAFRNDNGQTDPNVSSLFDFTQGIVGMLGDQFAVGPLNTDRRQVVNGQLSYTVPKYAIKGLTLGTSIKVQSGTPVSELIAHPAYGNAGEIPLGGRGKEGRTPVVGTVDLHADMPFRITERQKLHVTADFFNVANAKRPVLLDQYEQLNGGTPNPDFLSPAGNILAFPYQQPFYARFSVKWEF